MKWHKGDIRPVVSPVDGVTITATLIGWGTPQLTGPVWQFTVEGPRTRTRTCDIVEAIDTALIYGIGECELCEQGITEGPEVAGGFITSDWCSCKLGQALAGRSLARIYGELIPWA